MKKVLLLAILLGGAIAVLRLSPGQLRERLAQRRERWRERAMGRLRERFSTMMELMPEESPPKVVMSGIRRMQEQNEQLLALLREQNDLLRERLSVQESSPLESPSSTAEPQQDQRDR